MAGKRSTSEIVKLEEEFTVWKKKTPELYDLVICHAPEWPSLTVHWSPSPPRPCIDDSSFCTHGLLLGTNTPDEHIQDFLLVAEAVLPTESDSEGRHGESLSIPRVSFPYPCIFFPGLFSLIGRCHRLNFDNCSLGSILMMKVL